MLHLNNLGTLYFVLGTISLLRHLGFYQQKLKKPHKHIGFFYVLMWLKKASSIMNALRDG